MFFVSSRDLIRRHAFQVALEIALNAATLIGLIIILPIVRQLPGRLVSVESQLVLTPVLPPIHDSHCNHSSLSFLDMSIYATMLGLFVYGLFFFGVSISQDERERVQAILGIIVEGIFLLATGVVRERIGRLFRTVAYPVKAARILRQNLRGRLGTMRGFRACLGATIRLLMATSCLFSFCLSVAALMPCCHHQPFSKCARSASCNLPFIALGITDRTETLFNTVLVTAVPFIFGLRFLVCSLLSSIAFMSYHHMKTWPKPSLLINDDEKQGGANYEDEQPAESDKDTLCNIVDLKVDEEDVGSQVQEAVSVPNDGKDDGLNQRSEAVINRLSSDTEDPKHTSSAADGPSFRVGPVRSKSLQHQQVQKFGSTSQTRPYKSSLSASSQEFVPRFSNRAVCVPAFNYYPPHWAPAHPVSVRITAPEMIVSPMALDRLRGTPELPVVSLTH